jgi:acyl carrier protein
MSQSPGDRVVAAADIHERLLRLVAEALGRPAAAGSLPIEDRLSELGMSSIKMVNLMLAVEVEFDLTIPQQDITPDNFRSVASVEAMLTRLLGPRS